MTLRRVCPVCAVSCGNPSALDHLPESATELQCLTPLYPWEPPAHATSPQSVSSVRGVPWEPPGPCDYSTECVQRCAVSRVTSQPWVICLSPLLELQCLTPCLAWVRQLVLMRPNSDVIRWSMKGGASIPPCISGTIFRSG